MDSEQPYFFLSYARKDDRQAYVGRFYEDLLDALGLPVVGSHRQPAFRDVDSITLGHEWLLELSRAVGACRAMVARYSPAYFSRPYCGKEWTHFASRVRRYRDATDVHPRALIPVLWEPVPASLMPTEVKAVQFVEPGLGEEYVRNGLLQLMQSDPGGPAYRHVVAELAERVRRAAYFNLPVDAPPAFDLSTVEGCFPLEEAPGELAGHVRIFVAAATRSQLPQGRSRTTYYGESPWLWAPYSPPQVPTVVERAKRVIAGRASRRTWHSWALARSRSRAACGSVYLRVHTEHRSVKAHRDVAQLGSALDWGSRGRRFKSCRPDLRSSRSEVISV
ncbi:hypothetical protein SGFS_025330 [Streptomyces graminofaciens]|uniref:TIR domain-containing protein n=1 Tax=Streptomyces graminofaciens TaxID=68212 RepID=A0ABN5VDW4_9ACTN|nr:hypothetical protein SGFS_025330 [Streptomyces graminofaciens]